MRHVAKTLGRNVGRKVFKTTTKYLGIKVYVTIYYQVLY